MKKKSLLAMLLVLTMLAALLVGCGSTDTAAPTSEAAPAVTEESTAEAPENTAAPASAAAEPVEASEEADSQEAASEAVTFSYPVEAEDTTVSMFISFPGNLSNYMASFNDHPGFQILQEATGVTIEFVEASMESASQQFELMAASDDFTDIVSGFADMYTGGAAAAYEQDMIYDLTEYLPEYAPDYLALVNANEDYQKLIYEADGTTLGIYGLFLYDYTSVTSGLLIRQDLSLIHI